MKRFLLSSLLLILLPLAAHADAAHDEARAQRLFTEIRCVQCQSESIADSDAQIANDMRRQIRLDIAQGKDDAAIRKELFDHYGDYVLFRPRLSFSNIPLWLLPPFLLLMGGVMV
ncbi:MAG: cytochrome c-type biogenesis protein, partial [Asticcacaulis sp.]